MGEQNQPILTTASHLACERLFTFYVLSTNRLIGITILSWLAIIYKPISIFFHPKNIFSFNITYILYFWYHVYYTRLNLWLVVVFNFDKISSAADHSLWHSKLKYSFHMPWHVSLFKYSNLRQVSPQFHICVSVWHKVEMKYSVLCHVSHNISRHRRQNFCLRFYDWDLNKDKSPRCRI